MLLLLLPLQESTSLQPTPGRHSEDALQALDWVLHTASQYGLRVVLTLTDNWRIKDGKKQVRLSSSLLGALTWVPAVSVAAANTQH